MTDTLTVTMATATVDDVRERARQLPHVVQRIAQDPDLPAGADPQRVMEETLKFLQIAASSHEAVSPSRTVDVGWHHFILFTRDYLDYTARHLGRFVHHVPDDEDGATGGPADPDGGSYRRTRQRIVERFGAIDETLWPDVDALADCKSEGNCSSDCSGDCSSD